MSTRDLFDLHGQTVVVTGAASGIGLAIAEAMLEAGANLVISDVDAPRLAAEAARLRSVAGQSVHEIATDVSRAEQVDALMREALQLHGTIDTVFANAGISAGRGFVVDEGALENVDVDAWSRVLDINLTGVLLTLPQPLGQ